MTTPTPYAHDVKTLIPGPKAEGWRYADLSLIRGTDQSLAAAEDLSKVPEPVTGWPFIVIGNGRAIKKPGALKGVEISFEPDRRKKAEPPANLHPLARIGDKHAGGGVVIKITKGAVLEGLEILILEEGPGEGARHIRNRIVLGDEAKASILLRTINRRPMGWTNAVTAIAVAKRANLDLAVDFEAADKTLTSSLIEAEVRALGRLDIFTLAGGVPSLRHETEVNLRGKGATTTLAGGLLADDGETIDVLTRVHHAVGDTKSDQVFKGVAGARGKTAFQGRVRVEEEAQKIEAHQNCHNLILEAGGEANVKPELLIFADDVICSHGATVGEVDETALFYMMQRGIPEKQARAMLIQAFLGEALEILANDELRSYFTAKAGAWMKGNLA